MSDQQSGWEGPGAGSVEKGSRQVGKMQEEVRSREGREGVVGRTWPWGLGGEPLTPNLCLGMSTELSLQQDNQKPGPEEALGECPLPDLLGAGGGHWPAHHPDCATGHLSPVEQWGQQCSTCPGCRRCLRAWGLTQLGLEDRPRGRTGWFWSPENPGVCLLPSEPPN